jgi:SAM-dependent methyltransferase
MSGHEASEWATGKTGERWLEHIERFEGMLTEIGDAAIAHAGFGPSDRVVDVGCGCGPTTLAIASKVGSVTGIDVAPKLVALATERAARAGIGNADFQVMDAQTGTPAGAPFDRLFSRFGVMFFGDSEAAFRNMHGWLKPGGRMDIAVWAMPDRNPWFGAIGGVMAAHLEMPAPEPDAPGPFRLGDPIATSAMLTAAGFKNVHITDHVADQPFGGPGATTGDAIEFCLKALDMQGLLDNANTDTKGTVLAELRAIFEAHQTVGGIMMPGCSLFISAVA